MTLADGTRGGNFLAARDGTAEEPIALGEGRGDVIDGGNRGPAVRPASPGGLLGDLRDHRDERPERGND